MNAFKQKHGFGYYRSFGESAAQNLNAGPQITVPVLAVGAEFAIGEGIGIGMKKVSGQVAAVNLKNCGHYVPEEQPEKLLELLFKHIGQ